MNRTLAMLAGLICLEAVVSPAHGAAGWTSYGTVVELRPTSSGRFLIHLELESNPTDCRNKRWFFRDYTGMEADPMFRTFLAAVTSGKEVRVYVTGRCDIHDYSEISAVGISS